MPTVFLPVLYQFHKRLQTFSFVFGAILPGLVTVCEIRCDSTSVSDAAVCDGLVRGTVGETFAFPLSLSTRQWPQPCLRQEVTFKRNNVLIVWPRRSCGNTVGFSHIGLECLES